MTYIFISVCVGRGDLYMSGYKYWERNTPWNQSSASSWHQNQSILPALLWVKNLDPGSSSNTNFIESYSLKKQPSPISPLNNTEKDDSLMGSLSSSSSNNGVVWQCKDNKQGDACWSSQNKLTRRWKFEWEVEALRPSASAGYQLRKFARDKAQCPLKALECQSPYCLRVLKALECQLKAVSSRIVLQGMGCWESSRNSNPLRC